MKSRGAGAVLALAAALSFPGAVRGERSTVALACAESDFRALERALKAAYAKDLRENGPWGRRAAAALAKARFVVASPVSERNQIPFGVGIMENAVMSCCADGAVKINHDYLHSWSFNEGVLLSSAPALARFMDLTSPSAVHESFHFERDARFGAVAASRSPVEEELVAEYGAAFFALDRARSRPESLTAADSRVGRVLRLFDLDARYSAEYEALDRKTRRTDAERDRILTLAGWLNAFRARRDALQAELADEPGKPGLFWVELGLLARSNERFERAVRSTYSNRRTMMELPLDHALRTFLEDRLGEARREAERRRASDADLFARFANL